MQVEPEQRTHLINIVEVEGATIKKAANLLGINYSTAKHIIKQHKAANPHISNLNQLALTQRLLKDKQSATTETVLQKIQQSVADSFASKAGSTTANAQIEEWHDKKAETQVAVVRNDTVGTAGLVKRHVDGRLDSELADDRQSGEKQFDVKSSPVKAQKLLLP